MSRTSSAGGEKIDAPGKFYVVDHLCCGSGNWSRRPRSRHRHPAQGACPCRPPRRSCRPTFPPCRRWSEWFNVRSIGQNPTCRPRSMNIACFTSPWALPGERPADAQARHRADWPALHRGPRCSAIVSPKDGSPFVSGLGFSSIAGSPNILWNSGEKSVMDDIAFGGGGFGGGGFGRGGPARGGGPAAASHSRTCWSATAAAASSATSGSKAASTNGPAWRKHVHAREDLPALQRTPRPRRSGAPQCAELGIPLPANRGGVRAARCLRAGHRGLPERPVRQHLHVPRLAHRRSQ